MANGQMLQELREMAQADKITTTSALRLLIVSNIETLQKLTSVENSQRQLSERLNCAEHDRELKDAEAKDEYEDGMTAQTRLIHELKGQVELLANNMSKDIKAVSDRIDNMVEDPEIGIKRLFKNPAIVVGFFFQQRPKLAIALFIVTLLFLNLWLVDEFRFNVLRWLHVPEYFINWMNTPLPLGTPGTPKP